MRSTPVFTTFELKGGASVLKRLEVQESDHVKQTRCGSQAPAWCRHCADPLIA